MKKTLKTLILITIITILLILVNSMEVQAALQANPNTHYKKLDVAPNWMTNFRKMEEAGGVMGLSEELNDDLTSKTSNGIDVHMMRATEYGAIAILSASGYGNSQTLQNSTIKTTTGNNTGVYFSGSSWEYVAGGLSGSIFSGVNSRYYDAYTEAQTSAKIGDALGNATTTNSGCARWHTSSESGWVNKDFPYFWRDNGGLFSFNPNYEYWIHYYGFDSVSGRGVAVCGQGL